MPGIHRPCNAALLALIAAALPCPVMAQGSWVFAPGAYTHSPVSGQRVAQYAQHEPVEGLPDPRQTISRYSRTRTNLRGADGSQDTYYEVRSFGNTLGGFDAQRERGFDAQQQTLRALEPFRHNPYLFFGGLQGFGYGFPGYPAAMPGLPIPGPQGQPAAQPATDPNDCPNGDCQAAPAAQAPTAKAPAQPAVGQPGTAWPYAPPAGFVAPPYPWFGFYGPPYGYGPRPAPYGWRR